VIVWIAGGDEILVIEITQPCPFHAALQVAIIDQKWLHPGQFQRLLEHGAELGVADQHLGAGMVQHEGNGTRIESRVDGMEHGARHGHAVMRLEHGRRIGEHHRDGISVADASGTSAEASLRARA
jgi:hypothetical protein